MHVKFTSLVLALITTLSFHAEAQTPSATVWRIGTFDRSSAEFADGSPQTPVTFVIGKDQPEKSWYGLAPAAAPGGHSDISSAPRTIRFSITGKPVTGYRLRVAVLVEQAGLGALRVSFNGRSGTFYLHPELDYSMGDAMDAFNPAFAHADIDFDFPGNYLREGENDISLQAVAAADKAIPDAGFNYDAIELDQSGAPSASPQVTAEPTIFFQQHEGSLAEQLNVFLRYRERPRSGKVSLEIAGRHYDHVLRTDQDFGEERFEIAVPEFQPDTPASITVNLNGHATHFRQTLQPRKKWTLYLVPHVHLDVGYSDYQAKVATIQSRILDEAMDLTAKHPAFRFSTDGEWNLEQYLNTRTAEEKQRIKQAIRQEQLFIPAQYANLLTGFPTAETLIRSLYPSADFSRENKTSFNFANITDVPSYSWSYASVLASAGLGASCSGEQQRPRPGPARGPSE